MRFSTIAASLALPLAASAAPIKRQSVSPNDILVLQFAEVLERLEAQFYEEALAKFEDQDFIDAGIPVPDVARQNLQGILEHELAHAKFLQDALDAVGGAPVEGCTFNFDPVLTDVATMAVVARVVEAVGVGAYAGATELVDDKGILLAAASILTIEARHQSILNTLNGATAVPQAFDLTLTPEQVLALAGGFISGCDLGIVPNKPLAITNQDVVEPGTLLTFDFEGLADVDEETLSCQMIIAGQATALSFPLAECFVPDGINGPVAIFITNDLQPVPTNIQLQRQNPDVFVAGPTIAFIDTIPDALGSLVREGGPPIDSTEDISQDEAQDDVEDQVDDSNNTDAVSDDAETETETDSEEATSTSADAAAPTDGAPATPENAAAAPPAPPIKVIGEHRIPA